MQYENEHYIIRWEKVCNADLFLLHSGLHDCYGLLRRSPTQSTDKLHLSWSFHRYAKFSVLLHWKWNDFKIRDSGLICLVILLNLILAAEGLMLGSVCVYFEADAVLIAVGICAAVTLALTLFAFQVCSFCVLSWIDLGLYVSKTISNI